VTEELNLDDESEIPGLSESISASKVHTYSDSSDRPGSESRKASVFSAPTNNDDGTIPVSLKAGVCKFKETAL
jgi:hypothetical protein